MTLGRQGQAMAAEDARRLAAGEPYVRDRTRQHLDWAWTFVCPFPNDCGPGSLHAGFETPDHCRAGWIGHCRIHHAGSPVSWPIGTPGDVPGPFAGAQPVTKPKYPWGVTALGHDGVLVALDGRHLTLDTCPTCREYDVLEGATCPVTLDCPRGHAGPGDRCPTAGRRAYCLMRMEAAEAVDLARELAGDPDVAAPWPDVLAARLAAEVRPEQMAFDLGAVA